MTEKINILSLQPQLGLPTKNVKNKNLGLFLQCSMFTIGRYMSSLRSGAQQSSAGEALAEVQLPYKYCWFIFLKYFQTKK